MMKKISLALVAALLLMVCGCGRTQPQAQIPETEAVPAAVNETDTASEGSGSAGETASTPETEETASEKSQDREEIEPPEESKIPDEEKDIVILFTGDIHCGIDQGFGLAGLAQIRETLEQEGCLTMLVDNGDAIQGEYIGTLTRGRAIIELMNELHYDVAIPGNHEFDYGMENFLSLAKSADFPYISCNFNKEGELVFDPVFMKEIGGRKIGFVGVITPWTLISSVPKSFKDEDGNFIYGFMQDEDGHAVYAALQKGIDDLKKQDADVIVVLGHMGNIEPDHPYTYADLISHTSGIDVFLDGHSHDTDSVEMKDLDGDTVQRIACGTKMQNIGWVRISAKDGSITTGLYTWNNDMSAPALLRFENEISKEVDKANELLSEVLDQVVAKTNVDLTIYDPVEKDQTGAPIRMVRRAETNLGDLCADAYRQQLGADIGLINGGGVRADIKAGKITNGDIIRVNPFGNHLCMIEATGQQILDALEWGSRNVPEENGGFLQVSGLTYEIRTDVADPCTQDENGMCLGISEKRRVQNVMVGDAPIDPKKTYTVASHSFLLRNNGDGFTQFDGCKVLLDDVILDNQALINYITEALDGEVREGYEDPYGDGRIKVIEKEP